MNVLPCPVSVHARQRPESIAVIDRDGRAINYSDFDSLVRRSEAALRRAGLNRGATLALRVNTSVSYIATLVACLRAGITSAPLSSRLPDAEVATRVAHVSADVLIEDELWFREHIRPVRSDDAASWDLDSAETIVFTSGSTGRARAAVLSAGNHVASAIGASHNIPVGLGDRWLLSLPLYHVGGLALCVRCLLAGAAIVLSDGDDATMMRRERITHASFVATQLARFLDDRVSPLPRLRALLIGGSAVATALTESALEAGLPLFVSYGMTEMASQVSTTRPGAGREELATAGFVLPGREVRIGDGGTLHVRGKTRFRGFRSPDGMDQPFDGDGWYATSDTGFFDPEGRLVIRGRIDDVFISGGENIHPAEIERALTSIAGVDEAVVVPVADAEFGHRPVAFVRSNDPLDPAGLRRHLAARIPRFMIPVAFHPMPPMEGKLKPDRHVLRELATSLAT